jgi:hypothetical protein
VVSSTKIESETNEREEIAEHGRLDLNVNWRVRACRRDACVCVCVCVCVRLCDESVSVVGDACVRLYPDRF